MREDSSLEQIIKKGQYSMTSNSTPISKRKNKLSKLAQPSVLWLGFGDIAARCAPQLLKQDFSVTGVCRSDKFLPSGVRRIRANLDCATELESVLAEHFDYIVCSFTPSGRSEHDYQQAYYTRLEGVLAQLTPRPPSHLIYCSSTRVYTQNRGEWLDENSPCFPSVGPAQILLNTEKLLLNRGFSSTVVRFSGIYGPNRFHLLRQVLAGKGGDRAYTNRIHVEDCAGLIAHLVRRHVDGIELPNCLVASDDEPVQAHVLRMWLAEQMHCAESLNLVEGEGKPRAMAGKRFRNKVVAQLAYVFRYANYRIGFPPIISAFLAQEKNN